MLPTKKELYRAIMKFEHIVEPKNGSKITVDKSGKLKMPDYRIIRFIEGDGIGPDIWKASVNVFDSAVKFAYSDSRRIDWLEVLAGEKAYQETGEWLPQDTLDTISNHLVAIKGPLTTPVGGGIRSLNVALRQIFDLYSQIKDPLLLEQLHEG